MSDTHSIVPEMTPSETAFFESGGTTEIVNEAGAESQAAKAEGETLESGAERQIPPGFVDKKALDEERTRRKTTEADKRKLETDLAELRGKFSIIERLRSPQQEAQPELTPETDIFGFAKKTGETVQELVKRLDAQESQNRERAEQGAFVAQYQTDAAQFSQKNPDFGNAYNFLLTARAKELVAMGYENQNEIHQALLTDEMAIAQMALGRGKSPAQMIYELAQQRGYTKPADPNAKSDAANKLDTIERGQNANKSLSNTGGGSGDGDVTAAMLLKMPNDEFEAWCTKHPAKAKALFGG